VPGSEYTSYTEKADGARTSQSRPFILSGKKYDVKVEANLNNGNVTQSSITLRKEVSGRSGKQYTEYATSYDGGKTWSEPGSKPPKTITPGGLTEDEIKRLKPGGNLNSEIKKSAISAVKTQGANEKQASQATSGIKPNQASPTTDPANAGIGTTSANAAAAEVAAQKALAEVEQRKEYGNLTYPKTLNVVEQDFIRFSMLEYVARGLGNEKLVVTSEARTKNRKTKGTVTLPIPAGISDSNTAQWGDSELGILESALAGFGEATITGGPGAGADAAQKTADNLGPAAGEVQTLAAGKFVQMATGVDPLTRKYGLVQNSSLELLFKGPALRNFTFSFKLSPRSKLEADEVMKIIRFFKQGMAAKKTKEGVFLRSPDTFKLEYYHKGTVHPYLNKFKECALTSCNVNYTPDGNYSRFYDGPMTSYELQLSFTELEPVFDSDYTNESTEIGY